MANEHETEDTDLSQENGSDQSTENADNNQQDQDNGQQQDTQQGDQQQEGQSQENYRGKLNATNRFLEKEGYEFNKDSKQWQKKPDGSQQAESSKEHKPAEPASLTRDEAIVIAKGYSEEELEHAKKVAVLENCTPVQALDNDLFKDWKAKRDKVAKEQAAQLPASRGSRATVKKSLNTPGLSDEEHKQLAKERMGK
jgi:hypothetical protein